MKEPDLLNYYSRRAEEYDRIYAKPERQEDLRSLRDHVAGLLAGRNVLELACGTGYWTEVLGRTARSVRAVDLAEETLEVARRRAYPEGIVRFEAGDAYDPGAVAGEFDAAFAGFWWSHVPLGRLAEFLDNLHRKVGPGSRVVFVDNRYVEGSSTALSRRDGDGNTYQRRRLDDGSEHEVLKNFPQRPEILAAVASVADETSLREWKYYWCLSYRVAGEEH